MRLQIDTDKKTITIGQSVSLSELFDTLGKLLPGGKWEDYTLTPLVWGGPTDEQTYPTLPSLDSYRERLRNKGLLPIKLVSGT